MKELLHDFLEFYRNSLLIGYFRKRGKSLVIPQIVFCIERLLEQNPEIEKIRILDLGTGEGHLLRVIQQIGKISGFSSKLELYGFDFDEEMLESAVKQNNIKAEFVKIDLRHDTLASYYGHFDIVVAVNTLHEVYSSYLGEKNKIYPREKVKFAKDKIFSLIKEIGKTLTENGSFILYDGLAARDEMLGKKIKFRIKNPILDRYFKQALSDFTLWNIDFEKKSDVITMKYVDFSWFVITFKYLNTKLWPFECAQTYQYFSKTDFAKAFHDAGLMRESLVYLSNDLGLWKNNIELVGKSLDFPPKAVMIVGSRRYIPSQYDYFAAK
ncbi:methyltransferase domain-containing protein [Candidatus Woesebacteria bacterium]|nr:methyltransferase domain-containing protein [Candidatus Woesebacteria bacterium]